MTSSPGPHVAITPCATDCLALSTTDKGNERLASRREDGWGAGTASVVAGVRVALSHPLLSTISAAHGASNAKKRSMAAALPLWSGCGCVRLPGPWLRLTSIAPNFFCCVGWWPPRRRRDFGLDVSGTSCATCICVLFVLLARYIFANPAQFSLAFLETALALRRPLQRPVS